MVEYQEGCKWCNERKQLEEIVRKVIREELVYFAKIMKQVDDPSSGIGLGA